MILTLWPMKEKQIECAWVAGNAANGLELERGVASGKVKELSDFLKFPLRCANAP